MFTFPRYDSYKDSGIDWIGEIPTHWSVKRNLGIFAERKETNHPELDLLSVTIEHGIILQSEVLVKKDSSNEDKSRYKVVRKGDLAYNKMRMWQGAIGMSEYNGIVSPAYIILNPRNKIYSKYFHYLYRTPAFINEADRHSYGIVSDQNSLRYEHFKTIYSPVPPGDEAIQIVAFLDEKTAEIDEAIAKKRWLIELLQEQKGILINTAVTQGLDPHVPMKESGVAWIGRIPAHWDVVPMKRIVRAKITDGPHETPKFVDAGIPFLSVEAAFDGKLHLDKARGFISQNDHEKYSAKVKPQMDDIFIVKSGSTTGKVVIVDFENEFSIWSPLALVRPKPELFDAQFLFISLQDHYFQDQVQTNWSKGTQPNIGMGDLENLLVIKPPLVEQVAISKSLKAQFTPIHLAISKSFEEINLLDEFRTVLIAEAVTGKIKV